MIREYATKALQEWRANRRLRLAGLVALAVAAFHVMAALEGQRQAYADRYASDLALESRLETMRKDSTWIAREAAAQERLDVLQEGVPLVSGPGLAQAELQNWLSQLAASTGMTEPRVQVEDTLDVPGHPDLWQVLARLEGQIPQFGHAGVLRALAEGLPWIQVERLEIAEGAPARTSVIVRGYYRRKPEGPAVEPEGSSAEQAGAVP